MPNKGFLNLNRFKSGHGIKQQINFRAYKRSIKSVKGGKSK
jgi:hypothetical protein